MRAAVWYVRRSPGTYLWLGLVLATTVAACLLPAGVLYGVLERRSTNIHELDHAPLRVLVASAFWLGDGGWGSSLVDWLRCLVLFSVFHAPAERWLGTARWLGVAAVAHVGASLVSEGALYLAIRDGYLPHADVFVIDVGVSYALAGVMAVLTYRIAPPWRYPYCAALLLYYGFDLLTGRTFTDLGHFSALFFGLACLPLVRGRGPGRWDPVAAARRLAHRAAGRRTAPDGKVSREAGTS